MRLARDTISGLEKRMRLLKLFVLVLVLAFPRPVLAVDPPYQAEMERLAEIMGSLYFLAPLCRPGSDDWRGELAELVRLDQPDEDRQQRLYGAFNSGFAAYSRLYKSCTDSAAEALNRLLTEAETTARDIHARFAE
ncbi:MAG: TIGR02301 family protein [Devosia sp.]